MIDDVSNAIYDILNTNYDTLKQLTTTNIEVIQYYIYNTLIEKLCSLFFHKLPSLESISTLFSIETTDINTQLQKDLHFKFLNQLSEDMKTDVYQKLSNTQCGGLAVLQALKAFPEFKRILLNIFTNTWGTSGRIHIPLQSRYLNKDRTKEWGDFVVNKAYPSDEFKENGEIKPEVFVGIFSNFIKSFKVPLLSILGSADIVRKNFPFICKIISTYPTIFAMRRHNPKRENQLYAGHWFNLESCTEQQGFNIYDTTGIGKQYAETFSGLVKQYLIEDPNRRRQIMNFDSFFNLIDKQQIYYLVIFYINEDDFIRQFKRLFHLETNKGENSIILPFTKIHY
jgi:hypothetical protein